MNYPLRSMKEPFELLLPRDDLHAFVLDISTLTLADVRLDHFSSSDRQRIKHFVHEIDQLRFGIARTALYALCARYMSVNERDIALEFNDYGKPRIRSSELSFNVSHSGMRVALAFCWQHEIGIDVQEVLPQEDLLAVAERFFSPSERRGLAIQQDVLQMESFYRCWTRKEALIKALGLGVSAPLDSFSVEFRAGFPAAIVEMEEPLGPLSEWLLEDLPIAPDYAGAIACHHPHKNITFKELSHHELVTLVR